MKMEKILEVEHLAKHYPGFTLHGVSFSLDRGYIMDLIGPNGAGKSTVVRLIMNNLIRADAGTVSIFGKDMTTMEGEINNPAASSGVVGYVRNWIVGGI